MKPIEGLVAGMVLCLVFACGNLHAQTVGCWQPSSGTQQVPIWPKEAPDPLPMEGPEFATTSKSLFAGKPATMVGRVSQPTMTVYPPKAANTGVV